MIQSAVDTLFNASTTLQKQILALLAIAGEPVGRKRIGEYLTPLYDGTAAAMSFEIDQLRDRGLVTESVGRGFTIEPKLAWPAIASVLRNHTFGDLRDLYLAAMPMRTTWQGSVSLRSYRHGLALLRLAFFDGEGPKAIANLLAACLACHESAYLHPLVEIFGRPFVPDMIEQINPALRADVMAVLLNQSQRDLVTAPAMRDYALELISITGGSVNLRAAVTEHLILCGRLDEATRVMVDMDTSTTLYHAATILLLRDDSDKALAGFEAALKALRKETGKRKAIFEGFGGYLYVTALLRSGDPKHEKAAEAYLDSATRAVQSHDTAVYQQLSMLRQIRAGTVDTDVLRSRNWETALQPVMFRALMYWWLGVEQLSEHRARLEEALDQANGAGFALIATQLAGVLGHMGFVSHEREAIAMRQNGRLSDMTLWFAREEPWQRQLNALINLQPAVNVEAVKESRLVWLLRYQDEMGVQHIEPREQKRDAQGGWSRGRAVGLKRLSEEAAELDYLTAQDLQVASTIAGYKYYGNSAVRYEFEMGKAVAALIGHPLLFWFDTPGTRIELLPGEPELLVKAAGGKVTITMRPMLNGDERQDSVVSRETPTRLRVVKIKDEHRRIAAILGEGLVVPLQAERQVLQAIGAISASITVQSDIGGSAADIEQIPADPRMHVHLLPYQQGLKMQILVRPLPGVGSYYPPGDGGESVIADVDGIRTEAKRDLNGERDAERELVGACHALDHAEPEHGEWLLGQPIACLELLAELQELDPARVVVAWPEGESFRVVKKVETQGVKLSIKRDRDWFAADGEVQVDENKVMDLRSLLESLRAGEGRFVALGNNQFMALSHELHRRLMELSSFSDPTDDGVKVHQLASFALEELAQGAGGVQSDKAWRDHLARLASTSDYVPQLPTTLQAELRDYQLEGFNWLARLAHWGVGACLADDMGLGKTLQALALLLLRAPDGPALVVAPTSVCMNWIAEAARFAPTLRVKLFGPGDRADMLAGAGAFDLVICSYGLLQLEAPSFAKVKWHSIVLDEAQAIKNANTRRSQAVMALQGDFKMVATGTPLENHLGELWNLFRFINPGLLGSADQFSLRFANPIERAQDKRAETAARARLRRLIQPFVLRRIKSQVLSELPPRTEIVIPVDLSADETTLYESLRRQAIDKLAGLQQQGEKKANQKAIEILAEMMKLRRACCNPNLVAPELNLASSKLALFAKLVDGLLENRHKVLVFSQFVDHLALIRQHLDKEGIRYQYLDGSTPMQERKRRVDAFQAGDGDLFLISLKAGGVGINLTAADYVIHMDPWWNPAVEDQASDRAHRMGQQRPVTIYRLVTRHTIEEGIVELHRHKRDLADSLLEGTDSAARLSPADMLAMLQEGLAK